MQLKKDNGKDLVILNDQELIIKGIFKDKIVKRDNILSACLVEDAAGNKGIVILTKDYRIIERRNLNMRWSDREKLKLIVDEININDIVFNYSYDRYPYWFLCYYPYLFWLLINNFIHEESGYLKGIGALICLGLVILMIIYIARMNEFKGVIYNVNKKKFHIVGRKSKIVKDFTIDDIEVDKKFKGNIYRYKVKNSKYKFILYKYVISYPTEYERVVDEVRIRAMKS